jgi:hypothetical protein
LTKPGDTLHHYIDKLKASICKLVAEPVWKASRLLAKDQYLKKAVVKVNKGSLFLNPVQWNRPDNAGTFVL